MKINYIDIMNCTSNTSKAKKKNFKTTPILSYLSYNFGKLRKNCLPLSVYLMHGSDT